MRIILFLIFLMVSVVAKGQTGEMRVYTVAGDIWTTVLGDGGPATAASLSNTEGIWFDCSRNLYISEIFGIRRVDAQTGIITTIAGNGTFVGTTGEGVPATSTIVRSYGIYVDSFNNIFIADGHSKRIRKVNGATGMITTYAGGGSDTVANGVPATTAALKSSGYVYGDKSGNIYIGDKARIRKVSTSGIITTIAGTGVSGMSGEGGAATNAQINGPAGMLIDAMGNLLFVDRGNAKIHKINKTSGVITTLAGTGSPDFSGDGGQATAAGIAPISFCIDKYGNLVIGDNGANDRIRKVDASTDYNNYSRCWKYGRYASRRSTCNSNLYAS